MSASHVQSFASSLFYPLDGKTRLRKRGAPFVWISFVCVDVRLHPCRHHMSLQARSSALTNITYLHGRKASSAQTLPIHVDARLCPCSGRSPCMHFRQVRARHKYFIWGYFFFHNFLAPYKYLIFYMRDFMLGYKYL